MTCTDWKLHSLSTSIPRLVGPSTPHVSAAEKYTPPAEPT